MPFKVVQLTDTHLFETPAGEQKGVNTCASLRAVVADVAARHPDFDALLLTGDLSQDETPGSYDLLMELLEPLRSAPVYAIPGNHDDQAHMRARLADGESCFVGEDVVLGNWRIIMLNSQVPGRVHGELGRGQIERLRETLAATDRHVVVALYHPPLDIGSAWIDASRCRDGDALLREVADPTVKAVVAGHVHQLFEESQGGLAVLTTPSTCVQFKPGIDDFAIDDAPPGYRVFELKDDGDWSSIVERVSS